MVNLMENKPPEIVVFSEGFLHWNGEIYRCALGRGGFKESKREGDGATPAGTFKLREVWYRADRMERPRTKLPTKEIKENDGWSDDFKSPNYNRPIKLPATESHEKLFRDDEVYDIVIPLGYNDEPPVPGLGSAIFMHIARPIYSPTEGCIALNKEDLLKVLETCDSETTVRVKPLVALVPPAQA